MKKSCEFCQYAVIYQQYIECRLHTVILRNIETNQKIKRVFETAKQNICQSFVEKTAFSLADLMKVVCKYLGINRTAISGKSCVHSLVIARTLFVYFAHQKKLAKKEEIMAMINRSKHVYYVYLRNADNVYDFEI
jgi:chromosomal replication initiation ATPase DnaA